MRKLKQPEPAFLQFLEVVNRLGKIDLPTRNLIRNKNEGGEKELIYRFLKGYPVLYEYVFGQAIDSEISKTKIRTSLHGTYEAFRIDRNLLFEIVDEFPLEPAAESRLVDNIFAQVMVEIGINGQLQFEIVNFKRFEGLDMRRLKRCVVCNDIFWLARTDKKACSKCANIAAQRAFQERNRTEINERRRENYQNKKRGIVR